MEREEIAVAAELSKLNPKMSANKKSEQPTTLPTGSPKSEDKSIQRAKNEPDEGCNRTVSENESRRERTVALPHNNLKF